jgi:hypothetical protein
MKFSILIITTLLFISCKKEDKQQTEIKTVKTDSIQKPIEDKNKADTIVISTKHKVNKIVCDLDGDNINETVEIVRSGKSGLRITFENGNKTDYLGLGNNVLKQGFDEIDWVGIFEKASKNGLYWNNVNDDGEIMADEEIKEEDKIKLLNDRIYIHAEESCGGGVIYLKDGKYEWIQQE